MQNTSYLLCKHFTPIQPEATEIKNVDIKYTLVLLDSNTRAFYYCVFDWKCFTESILLMLI